MTPEERAHRCEEAVDEWDGPQTLTEWDAFCQPTNAPPVDGPPFTFEALQRIAHNVNSHYTPTVEWGPPGTRVFSDELLARADALVQREAQRLQEEARQMRPVPALRVRADTAEFQARLEALNQRLDAFEEALQRSPSEVRQVDPARLRLFQALRGEPQPWHEELTRPGPERVYAYRRLTRRQRAKRALRTMLTEHEFISVAALTSIALIASIFVQGAVPALAWLGGCGLLVYAGLLHLFLVARFRRAYRRER